MFNALRVVRRQAFIDVKLSVGRRAVGLGDQNTTDVNVADEEVCGLSVLVTRRNLSS